MSESNVTESKMLTTAMEYAAARGWMVFPLHDVSSGACSCGKPDCSQGGKHPRTNHGVKDATTDPEQIRRWWSAFPHANIGVACGPASGVWLLGPDGEQGKIDLAELVEKNGPLPATAKAVSGSGGLHLYFKYPADGRKIRNRKNLHGTKIDVRAFGDGPGYFVAPGSTNKNGKYTWIDDRTKLADAPAWLLDWAARDEVRADRTPPPAAPRPVARAGTIHDGDGAGNRWSAQQRAVAYLDRCAPSVSGERGHDKLLYAARVVVYGFDLGQQIGYELLQAHFNPRCVPPWDDRDVMRKCQEANSQPFDKPRGWLLNEERERPLDRPSYHSATPVTICRQPAAGEPAVPTGEPEDAEDLGPVHVDSPDNPHRLAHGFLASLPRNTLRFWRGEFLEWRFGAYVFLTDDEVKGRLTAWVREEFIRVNEGDLAEWNANGCKGKMPTAIKVTNKVIGDALNALRSVTMLTAEVKPPQWVDSATGPEPKDVIAMRNGLLDTTTRRLLPATPSFFTLNALAFDYLPDAPRPALWYQFLTSVWADVADPSVLDEATISTLQEWFGYLIKSDTSQQKMLFMIGPTRSGKGTIARILAQLVGEQNLAGPTLGSLTGTFGLSPLYGKSVAVISDARLSGRADTAVIVERLLSITGEDAQTVDRKYRDEVSLTLGVRFVILSNELPKLNDASGALVNRMILIRFTRSFLGRENTKLTEKLIPELPGILLWALDGLDRLRQRGKFTQPPSSEELIQDMSELSSPISSFVRDRIVLDLDATTPIRDAFTEWKAWCEDHGRDHTGTEQSFGRDLRAAVPTITSSNLRGSETGGRYRVYRGIRLRTALDDMPHAAHTRLNDVRHKEVGRLAEESIDL